MIATSTIGFTPGTPAALDLFLMETIFAAPLSRAADGARLGQFVCSMAREGMSPVPPERAHLDDEVLYPVVGIWPYEQEVVHDDDECTCGCSAGSLQYPAPPRDIAERAAAGDPDATLYVDSFYICNILGGDGRPRGASRSYSVSDHAVRELEKLAARLDPQKHRIALAHVMDRIGDLKPSAEHHKRAVEIWMPMCGEGEFGTMDARSVLAVFQNAAFDVWQTRDRGFIYPHLGELADGLCEYFKAVKTADDRDRLNVAGIAQVTAANLLVASAVAAFAEGLGIESTLAMAYITWNYARGLFVLGDMGCQDEGATQASAVITRVVDEFESASIRRWM